MTMGTNNAFPNVIRDWTGLLAACADNASSLQPAEPQREALVKILAEAEELKNRQEALIGARQEITQKLKVLVKDGQEAARRLRGAVKANLGTKNERLVQFKMAPNRPRGPRKTKKKPVTPPPGDGTAPKSTEALQSNPAE
jgi:hypothetical protein